MERGAQQVILRVDENNDLIRKSFAGTSFPEGRHLNRTRKASSKVEKRDRQSLFSGTLSNRVVHLFSLSCPESGSRWGGDKEKAGAEAAESKAPRQVTNLRTPESASPGKEFHVGEPI